MKTKTLSKKETKQQQKNKWREKVRLNRDIEVSNNVKRVFITLNAVHLSI